MNTAKISRAMNEQFIPLKINSSRNPDLASALQIQYYPTVVLSDSDGKILGTMEGYQKAPRFYERLQRCLAMVANPEWMIREYQSANKALAVPDYAKAFSLLEHVLEDGKSRPIQTKARRLLGQIEDQAAQQLARANQLKTDGQTSEAMNVLTNLIRDYPGTKTAGLAGRMLTRVAETPAQVTKDRVLVAKEMLGEAREFYRKQKFSLCLDVCGHLADNFGDLPEAGEARELRNSIQSNTVWMQKSCDELRAKLARRMLLLADAYYKKGSRKLAMETFQGVQAMFPQTREAQVAEYQIRQLRGEPAMPVDFQRKE